MVSKNPSNGHLPYHHRNLTEIEHLDNGRLFHTLSNLDAKRKYKGVEIARCYEPARAGVQVEDGLSSDRSPS